MDGWGFAGSAAAQETNGWESGVAVADWEDGESLRQTIAKREEAVNRRNEALFMSTIDPRQQTYYQEEKRWFEDAKRVIKPGTYRIQIVRMHPVDKRRMRVEMRQSYQILGQNRRESVQFPTIWERTSQGWKGAGLHWLRMERGATTVLYSDPRLKRAAQVALDTMDMAIPRLGLRYGWKPERVEIKLYHQAEVFRQSVKPSLPRWAAGWHEANEAIKFVIHPQDSSDWLRKGLVHELTHQMVSELTHDNAAYWLQEGAAMYYEAHLFQSAKRSGDQGIPENQHPSSSRFSVMTLEELERTQLERLPTDEASRFYLSAYDWFKRMVERKDGEKKMGQVWAWLRAYPYVDQDSEKKLGLINDRTREAMKKVPGFSEYWKEKIEK